MDFKTLYDRISPRLKQVARRHNGHGFFIDEDDLYQEMCLRLWNNFKDGVPEGINDSYIIKGCEFHILNYLRVKRDKAATISLEGWQDEEGRSLEEVLPGRDIPVDNAVHEKITIDEIKNNGFTKREKQVFSLLLKGYTVREAGKELGISHVMVVKFKQRIIKKWQKKGLRMCAY